MKNMADYLDSAGMKVYIIDNNSDYQPLLDYYASSKYEVIRMDKNYGYTVFWDKNLYEKFNINGKYILTDSDLDISEIPKDFLSVLERGLEKYPQYDKCGFSLKINDLPDNNLTTQIKNWETQFWKKPLDDEYFHADIDTTFALYKVNYHTYSAIRTNIPYCAKHVPWYYEKFDLLSEDEKYYFNSIDSLTHWSKEIKNL